MRTMRMIAALLVALGSASVGADTFLQGTNRCTDALLPFRQLHIGAERITTYESVGLDIENMRVELRQLRTDGVVVYMPVYCASGGSGGASGIATLRFEVPATGQALIEQVLAPPSPVSERTFAMLLNAARQPLAEQARQDLGASLPTDPDRDAGKAVFVKDSYSYGLLPSHFGDRGAIGIASGTLAEAISKRRALEQQRAQPKDFTSIVGYPDSGEHYRAVFKGTSAAPLETWRKRLAEFRSIAKGSQHVVTAREMGEVRDKRSLLAMLQRAKGIVFVVAHAEGATVRLPGPAGAIEITPGEIAGLHLNHSPFVVLRICNGVDHGYADAFARAGASGVWANRGVISADVANRQVGAFFRQLREGALLLDAIRHVEANDEAARYSTGLFVLRSAHGPGETG